MPPLLSCPYNEDDQRLDPWLMYSPSGDAKTMARFEFYFQQVKEAQQTYADLNSAKPIYGEQERDFLLQIFC